MKIVRNLVDKARNKLDKTPQYLALDIGTEYVKAMIVVDNGTGKGEIIGVGRQKQKLSDMASGAVTDIPGVVENCDAAIRRAEEMAGTSAIKTVIGIAGELVKGGVTTIKYERLKPKTKIELPELDQIMDKIQQKAFKKVRDQISWETGNANIDVKLVNAAVVDVMIDGYHVTNPIGFQGKDVSVSVFNAFAPLVHIGALQTIANNLGLQLVTVAAEPYAAARSVGSDEGTEFSAIFIDVGGGTTDIAVVRNGGIEGTQMFAIGGRTFTKRVANTLNTTFEKAEETKLQYSAGKLDSKTNSQIQPAIGADAEVWLSGVELSLSEFSNIDLLPSRILLCGGGAALPEVKKLLNGKTWYKSLPFAKKPVVSLIDPKDVSVIIDKTGHIKDQQDITPMGLASLAIDSGDTERIMDKLLSKVARVMQV